MASTTKIKKGTRVTDSKRPDGIDALMSFEAVYYAAPIPRGAAVLTLLGTVFDKVYFPKVYLPKDGYDKAALRAEIARLEALPGPSRDGDLVAMLRFIEHAKELDGFCIFTGNGEKPFQDSDVSQEMLEELHTALHGPNPAGWRPMFATNFHKSLPGGNEHVTFPGSYHYLAHAIIEAGKSGRPLVSDLPGLPLPGYQEVTPHNDAKALSTLLAIECVKLVLPALPVLRPRELMEFRAENIDTLRNFRRAMLAYARDLNGKIKDLSPADFEQASRFFVNTEIVPVLDVLKQTLHAPARPWYKRIMEGAGMLAQVGPAFLTMPPEAAVATALAKFAGQAAVELIAGGDHRAAMKRSGLYYLVNLQRYRPS